MSVKVEDKFETDSLRYSVPKLREVLNGEGPALVFALLRIGLVFLVWCRFAAYFRLFEPLASANKLLGFSLLFSTALLLLGFHARMACAWTAVNMGIIYYHLGFHQNIESFTHHHIYILFISFCFLALTRCGDSLSLDQMIRGKHSSAERGESETGVVPLWPIYLFRMQVSMIYFWSAWDKFNWPFLSGQRMEAILMTFYTGSDHLGGWFSFFCLALSISTVLIEIALVFALWLPAYRKLAVILGILFHLILYYTLPVATFSLTMCLLYITFFDPNELRKSVRKIL